MIRKIGSWFSEKIMLEAEIEGMERFD